MAILSLIKMQLKAEILYRVLKVFFKEAKKFLGLKRPLSGDSEASWPSLT
jgi:hypothetical protein